MRVSQICVSSAEWLHQTTGVEGDKALDCTREPMKVRDLELPTHNVLLGQGAIAYQKEYKYNMT